MSTPPVSTKDPNMAMVIEILAGYFGFLGIGYLYAGRTAAGLLRLFGWWAFLTLVILSPLGLLFLDDFSAVLCLLCLIPIMLAVPVISGLMLKHSMEDDKRRSRWRETA